MITDHCEIYLINLDRSKGRLQTMDSSFQQLGVSYKRMAAVYGPDATVPQGHTRSEFLSLGEFGCLLSHRNCYEALLKSDKDWALILEDDVLLTPQGWAIIEEAFSKKPQNCEVLKFQGQTENPKKLSRKVELQYLKAPYTIQYRIQNGLVSAGYFINKAGAQKYLSFRDLLEPADVILEHAWKYGVILYCVEPEVFPWTSALTASTISDMGRNDSSKGALWGRHHNKLHAFFLKYTTALKAVGPIGVFKLWWSYIKSKLL